QFNGLDLGGATNALLNLTNVQPVDAGAYSVVIANAAGSVTSSNATLSVLTFPPSIATQPQNRTITAGTNVSFSVFASGTGPLSYQWQKNGSALGGATASVLSLTNVQAANAGTYSVAITNLYGSVVSSNAILTVIPPPSLIQLSSITATSRIVVVPINLVAEGNENALGFSINFNQTLLSFDSVALGSNASNASLLYNTNQLGSGRLGLAISLASNTNFPAGTQEVAEVTFLVVPTTNSTVVSLSFGDQPTLRQVVNPQAGVVAAVYVGGSVTIPFLGFEGDVAPLPDGNRAVTIADWVQVGRFVAGLDSITNAGEFQRADCAPRPTFGNGLLTVSDWVQAGRYAAGLDPLTMAGGPMEDLGGSLRPGAIPDGPRSVHPLDASNRTLTVVTSTAQAGEACQLTVQLNSLGDENGLEFSLTFDPTVLSFSNAILGSGAVGAVLNVNSTLAGSGKIGFVLARSIGSTFGAGTQEVVKINFVVSPSAPTNTSISFTNKPLTQEVSDASALPLSTIYLNGTMAIAPQPVITNPTLTVSETNGNLMLSWPISATNFTLESSGSLASTNWTNVAGVMVTNATKISVAIPLSGPQQFYRLHHP
ncbi:MAG: Conserved repeat domain protein, partial [Pedosphaera sp.]|nr:Conserved repeat domain protein [Pedosphaera sp.]